MIKVHICSFLQTKYSIPKEARTDTKLVPNFLDVTWLTATFLIKVSYKTTKITGKHVTKKTGEGIQVFG